jgi:hypothetical protein
MNCSLRGSISFRMSRTLGQNRLSIKESAGKSNHEKPQHFMGHVLVLNTIYLHTLITGQ